MRLIFYGTGQKSGAPSNGNPFEQRTLSSHLGWCDLRRKVDRKVKLSELKSLRQYQEEHLRENGSLFPTMDSLKWFIRCHRDTLIDAGALILGSGSRGTFITPLFDAAVFQILVKSDRSQPPTV